MSIYRADVTSLSALAALMQEHAVPNIFKSVTYDNNTSLLTATDDEDNTVLTICNVSNASYFRAYRAENNYIGHSLRLFLNPSDSTIPVMGCDNGLMLVCSVVDTQGYGRGFAALFAKTNNDKVAIIFPSTLASNSVAKFYTALHHVAFGDSTTIATTTTFVPEAGQQTSFTSFKTNADFDDASYTPNAFYLDMHSAYATGYCKLIYDGDIYISGGYWAIKDGGAT